MASTVYSSSFQRVNTPSDEDIQDAIKQFQDKQIRGMRNCFGFPDKEPKFWIKFASEAECIEIEAKNMQYMRHAIERFYEASPSQQQKFLEPIYKKRRSPPRVRIPELFRIVQTEKHTALLMEFVDGETLDWRMRVKFNATSAHCFWKPKPAEHDLSVFKNELCEYADAIGVVLALPTRRGDPPGPVGGGFPNHSMFFNVYTDEPKLPYKFDSTADLANKVNEAAQRGGATKDVDFSGNRLHYVLSDLNNGNVMFTKNGDIYIIDHCAGGFYPLCFMTFVAYQPDTVSPYLRIRLQLPVHNLDTLRYAYSNFWLPEEETSSEGLADSDSDSDSEM